MWLVPGKGELSLNDDELENLRDLNAHIGYYYRERDRIYIVDYVDRQAPAAAAPAAPAAAPAAADKPLGQFEDDNENEDNVKMAGRRRRRKTKKSKRRSRKTRRRHK